MFTHCIKVGILEHCCSFECVLVSEFVHSQGFPRPLAVCLRDLYGGNSLLGYIEHGEGVCKVDVDSNVYKNGVFKAITIL